MDILIQNALLIAEDLIDFIHGRSGEDHIAAVLIVQDQFIAVQNIGEPGIIQNNAVFTPGALHGIPVQGKFAGSVLPQLEIHCNSQPLIFLQILL